MSIHGQDADAQQAAAFQNVEDILDARQQSRDALRFRLENVIAKFSQDYSNISDVINFSTNEVEVDNGHLRHMKNDRDTGARVEGIGRALGEYSPQRDDGEEEQGSDGWSDAHSNSSSTSLNLPDSLEIGHQPTAPQTQDHPSNAEPPLKEHPQQQQQREATHPQLTPADSAAATQTMPVADQPTPAWVQQLGQQIGQVIATTIASHLNNPDTLTCVNNGQPDRAIRRPSIWDGPDLPSRSRSQTSRRQDALSSMSGGQSSLPKRWRRRHSATSVQIPSRERCSSRRSSASSSKRPARIAIPPEDFATKEIERVEQDQPARSPEEGEATTGPIQSSHRHAGQNQQFTTPLPNENLTSREAPEPDSRQIFDLEFPADLWQEHGAGTFSKPYSPDEDRILIEFIDSPAWTRERFKEGLREVAKRLPERSWTSITWREWALRKKLRPNLIIRAKPTRADTSLIYTPTIDRVRLPQGRSNSWQPGEIKTAIKMKLDEGLSYEEITAALPGRDSQSVRAMFMKWKAGGFDHLLRRNSILPPENSHDTPTPQNLHSMRLRNTEPQSRQTVDTSGTDDRSIGADNNALLPRPASKRPRRSKGTPGQSTARIDISHESLDAQHKGLTFNSLAPASRLTRKRSDDDVDPLSLGSTPQSTLAVVAQENTLNSPVNRKRQRLEVLGGRACDVTTPPASRSSRRAGSVKSANRSIPKTPVQVDDSGDELAS